MEDRSLLKQEVAELEQRLRHKKELLRAEVGGIDKNRLFLPASIIVAALFISGSLFYTKGFSNNNVAGKQNVATIAGDQIGNQPGGSGEVSIDDDPVMGNKNAPITLIEFSDFECPFCKRSFDQMLPELKRDYIDAGKVKLVYRDFPLAFHTNAHKEAQAAECARDQGGDATYFEFHDQIFTRTTSNGTGLALTQLPVIAGSLGLDVSKFQKCLDSGKFEDEVDKDIADGTAVGVSGTPSWFIGQSTPNGIINVRLVVGAQPFSAFKVILDQMLNQ